MKLFNRLSIAVGLALLPHVVLADTPTPIKPKVMLITMFAPEAQTWIERLQLKQEVRVPGLSAEYPVIRCNTQDVCLLVTGMGQTNAAASTLALALSPKFDLRHSYFLIAGIAGINVVFGGDATPSTALLAPLRGPITWWSSAPSGNWIRGMHPRTGRRVISASIPKAQTKNRRWTTRPKCLNSTPRCRPRHLPCRSMSN